MTGTPTDCHEQQGCLGRRLLVSMFGCGCFSPLFLFFNIPFSSYPRRSLPLSGFLGCGVAVSRNSDLVTLYCLLGIMDPSERGSFCSLVGKGRFIAVSFWRLW